jgi:hypothetical protein
VFLLHDVHAPAPLVFATRWTLSYLRGPLSRDQIARLTPGPPRPAVAAPPRTAVPAVPPAAADARSDDLPATAVSLPVLPPGIPQYVVPGAAGAVRYRPVLLGGARVTFADKAAAVAETEEAVYAVPFVESPIPLDWDAARRLDVEARDLSSQLPPGATVETAPAAALAPKNYTGWQKTFARHVAEHHRLELWTQPELKLTSRPGETEGAFRVRVQDAQREARDAALDALRDRYEPQQRRLVERRRRAEASVERETQQASQQKLQTGLSVFATIANALFGRRAFSAGTIGRATTAARGVGRSIKEADDVRRATESVAAVEADEAILEAELRQEKDRMAADYAVAPVLTPTSHAPKHGGVSVAFVALGWLPHDGGPGA